MLHSPLRCLAYKTHWRSFFLRLFVIQSFEGEQRPAVAPTSGRTNHLQCFAVIAVKFIQRNISFLSWLKRSQSPVRRSWCQRRKLPYHRRRSCPHRIHTAHNTSFMFLTSSRYRQWCSSRRFVYCRYLPIQLFNAKVRAMVITRQFKLKFVFGERRRQKHALILERNRC